MKRHVFLNNIYNNERFLDFEKGSAVMVNGGSYSLYYSYSSPPCIIRLISFARRTPVCLRGTYSSLRVQES